jgi:hypothetical protein
MKDKIEVGEYIRTKNGYIRKIEKVIEKDNYFTVDHTYFNEEIQENTKGIILEEDVLKHSKNIIDLIEMGDYVNGAKTVSEKYRYNNINFINVDSKISYGWGEGAIMESEIETIVTKEQFKEMEYRV